MITTYATLEALSKSIKDIKDIKDIKEKKQLYGEVKTPLSFVEKILSIIPECTFKDTTLRWLDPGSGTGNFSIVLYFKLMAGLAQAIPVQNERSDHIIQNMIFMVELQPENITILKTLFGTTANICECDYLDYENPLSPLSQFAFDIVIGNPPFNCNGIKKVPTNSTIQKSHDGNTIWPYFVKKSVAFLKPNTGLLCIFIPSIWMKPDKEKMYEYLTQYDIQRLHCFSNTETNRLFSGNAQTPSCYFLLTKRSSTSIISLFDTDQNQYIDYHLTKGAPIPLFGQAIMQRLQSKATIQVIKTNMPSKKVKISAVFTDEYKYANISTCRIKKDNITPELIINYSNKPLAFTGVPKLVLAHKMYGFPYLDLSGMYGISNRDNYVIVKENPEDLIKLQQFLSTKTALYLFEATRYRMKYLERYAFQLIPDITLIPEFFYEIINDATIADYFGFSQIDCQNIKKLHSKNYNFF